MLDATFFSAISLAVSGVTLTIVGMANVTLATHKNPFRRIGAMRGVYHVVDVMHTTSAIGTDGDFAIIVVEDGVRIPLDVSPDVHLKVSRLLAENDGNIDLHADLYVDKKQMRVRSVEGYRTRAPERPLGTKAARRLNG